MKQPAVVVFALLSLVLGVLTLGTWGLFSIERFVGPRDSSEEIVISLVTDLSGIGAYWGRDSAWGARAAAEELRRDGVRVRLVIDDHAFKTTQAVSAVQRALSVSRADAVIVEFAPQAVAASSLLATHKTLFLNGSAAKSILDSHPYSFTSYLDYERHCRDIARYWQDKGVKKPAVLKPEAEFAELCLKGVKEVYPGVIQRSFGFGESLTTEVSWLKQKQVEVVFFPALEGDTLNLLKAMKEQSFVVPLAVTKMDSLGAEVVAKYSDLLQGTISFSLPEVDEELESRLRGLPGGEGIHNMQIASRAYMFVHQLVHAVDACPEQDAICQTEAMNEMPAQGEFRFLGWKDRIADYQFLIEEWHGRSSKVIEVGGVS